MGNDDRRYRRSEKLLQRGLVDLLATHDLKSISVRCLTEAADVHRSTFYAHYDDVYELYDQMIKQYYDDISDIIDRDYKGRLADCYNRLLEYIYANKELSMIVINNGVDPATFESALKLMRESCRSYWCKQLGMEELPDDLRYFVDYHVEGCFAIVRDIFNEGFVQPVEDAARMITEIDDSMSRFIKMKEGMVPQ
jgi:AcrR family transcriptional regulator